MLANRAQMAAAGANNLAGFIGDITTGGLLTGLQLCLDAGHIDSYGGSGQTWADQSGNGYDMAGQNTVTFNGTAGNLSSSEYWSFDGSDFFAESAAHGWDDNLSNDGIKFTLATWVYLTQAGDEKGFCGNVSAVGQDGITWHIATDSPSGHMQFQQTHGSTLTKRTDSVLGFNGWKFIALSVDENGGASAGFFYKNGAYDQSGSADTWNPNYPSVGTANGFAIASKRTSSSGPLPSGSRMAGFMAWTGVALSKANLDTLYNLQKTRFGL